MRKENIKRRLIHFIHAYGFNAILGFGLGIAIVLVVFAISGKPQSFGQDVKSGNTALISQEDIMSRDQGQSQGVNNLSEESSPQSELERLTQNLMASDISNELALKDRVTVLLIGMDNRPGETISNTDTLIVASLDQKSKKMVLLSIPRDTQVLLNNKKEKVNAIARLQKGAISTQKYLQELIGTPIDGYVLTNFQGFKNIVDSLGGITINVEKDMYYDTGDEQDRFINLKKGVQRLNGAQALQYARFRNDELADISRAARQQEVIKAILAEAVTPRNIPRLPIIIPKVYQAIETNLNLGQIWALSMAFKNKETYEVINQTLPGQFSDEDGISYWKVNPKQSKVILSYLFKGETSPIFDTTQKVKAPPKKTEVKTTESKINEEPEDNQEVEHVQFQVEEIYMEEIQMGNFGLEQASMEEVKETRGKESDPKMSQEKEPALKESQGEKSPTAKEYQAKSGTNEPVVKSSPLRVPEPEIIFEILE